jgi:hypothetical protein
MKTFATTNRSVENAPAHLIARGRSRAVRERENAPPVSSFSTPTIQRKASCACGGGCPACQAKSNDLRISQPNDPTEIEADQIANRVMRMRAVEPRPVTRPNSDSGTIQRKCSECEDEDETIHRKPLPSGGSVPAQSPTHVQNAICSGGRPLDRETRSFFEPRLGYDLSAVRIHMGGTAAESAIAIDARAYTLGSNIVFAAGEYPPDSESGQQLLAHELAHVAQQGWHSDNQTIHRCPDAASLTDFDTRVLAIRALNEFTALPVADRQMAEDILTTIRDRDDCIFMAERFHVLLTSPVDQSPAVGAAVSSVMATAADEERRRLATPEGRRLQNLQEDVTSSASRNWETLSPPPRSWGHMATFRIDRSDPNNIVVQVRIRVQGNPDDAANIVAQQDGIERAAQELGYTLDLIFVTSGGPDVFTVSVNPSLPVTAGNWSAYDTDPSGYTHEIHHLLGSDDRYDYTSHADNPRMDIHNRLIWFRVEAHRSRDPLEAQSLMGSGSHLLDDDICRVSQLNFASCMSARQSRRDMITRARGAAFSRSFRVFEMLSGIRPVAPVWGASDTREFQVRRMVRMAEQIFGTPLDRDSLAENIGDMRYRLAPGIDVQPMPSADSNCTGNAHYVVDMRPPIRLCPEFVALASSDQEQTFLRAAAQMIRLDNSLPVSLCTSSDCGTACGGFNSADTWAKYITCASDLI